MSTYVRTAIVKTLSSASAHDDIAKGIDVLAKGATVLSASVTPLKVVASGDDLWTRRVVVTLVLQAD